MKIRGKAIILGVFAVAIVASGFAIWYQARLTAHCLELWNAENVRRIQTAEQVELLTLADDPKSTTDPTVAWSDQVLAVAEHRDISRARGLIHLRAAFCNDRNFDWDAEPPNDTPVWKYGLRFGGEDPQALVIPLSAEFTWLGGPGGRIVSTGDSASGLAKFFGESLGER